MIVTFRMFWFVSFCASMIACGLLIQELYIKFKDFPIVISMNAESSDVQSVLNIKYTFWYFHSLFNVF